VMLHRAILGSFERFIGILLEENAGNLPLWLAPVQVTIASIVSGANQYAEKLYETLLLNNIRVKLDIRNEKINYKIREHSLKKIPLIYAVGLREVEDQSVTIRKLGSSTTEIQPSSLAIDNVITLCQVPE
jgi:threonyl-tRNA synthetase